MPTTDDDNIKKSVAKPAPANGKEVGLRRLIKSYVRMMNGYGLSDTIPASHVVNGRWGEIDEKAVHTAFSNAAVPAQDAKRPSEALLASIMDAHAHSFTAQGDSNPKSLQLSQHYQGFLDKVTEQAEEAISTLPRSMQNHLHKMHPLLRSPAVDAIHEIQKQHKIPVRIVDSFRPPELQDDLVRKQVSYAPNGYSMHGHGLALDIAPLDAKGNPIWNTKHPAWKTIMDVMQKHGFYSLGADRNWDYPHFELPLRSKEVLAYAPMNEGWRMIPPNRIPEAMRAHYGEALERYEVAEKLLTNAAILKAPPMLPDKTAVARPFRLGI